MELKGKDLYKVEKLSSISSNNITALMLLYQPIVGHNAITLYLTLVADHKGHRTFDTHSQLLNICGLTIYEFEEARKKLEELDLIRTYVKYGDLKNNYIYVINQCKTCEEFLQHDIYARLLSKYLEPKQLETLIARLQRPISDKNEYTNISSKFDYDSINWNTTSEIEFSKIKPKYNFNKANSKIKFDYDKFLRSCTRIIFPIEARTDENLRIIGEVATIYGITPDKMRLLVGRCSDPLTNTLNIERVKSLAKNYVPKATIQSNDNPYKLSCASFLQSKQNGVPLTSNDEELLTYLVQDLKMNPDVVNVMIEYILNINDNKLPKKYVQSVASTWIRNKINTLDEAINYVNKINNKNVKTNTKKETLPDYMQHKSEKVDDFNADDKAELIDWLKNMED